MTQKNVNSILANTQKAYNCIAMEIRSASSAGRDAHRLEYIAEKLRDISSECEDLINQSIEVVE